LCALALLAWQEVRGAPAISVFSVGSERKISDGLLGDLNGDGLDDLAFSVSRKTGGREIVVFRARSDPKQPRFGAPADATIELTPDVVAWAIGDVDGNSKGSEIVLFSARGAFACLPFAAAEKRFSRLVECDFLWQLGDEEHCFAYPAALVDIDGDGAVDLVLPEPDGFAVARQQRPAESAAAAFPRVIHLRVPKEIAAHEADQVRLGVGRRGGSGSSGGEEGNSLSISLGGREVRRRTLLAVNESTPAPQWSDFNGDRRLDLHAQGLRSLWVWLQAADGSFTAQPQLDFSLPVPADMDRRMDASYSTHVLDADRDGRSDVAIFAGDRRSDDVRTQLLLFVQGKGRGDATKTEESPLFGPKNIPQQLLVLGGFGAGAYFDDLDADGKPDLFVRTVRPDLIDQLRSVTSESLDADLLVYRNENGEFSKRPSLSWRVAVPLKNFDLTLRFVCDLNGDRLADLVVRSEPERLRFLAMRRAKEGWLLDSKPLYETSVRQEARILLLARSDRAVSDVAVIEDSQVMLVRFP
jgi:hypothetical protein